MFALSMVITNFTSPYLCLRRNFIKTSFKKSEKYAPKFDLETIEKPIISKGVTAKVKVKLG